MKNNLLNMMCLDVYLSNASERERENVKHEIEQGKTKVMPLLSWDLFATRYNKYMQEAKVKVDIAEVMKMAKELKWQNDLDSIFKKNDFEALVITDLNKRIIWVNDGFSQMTGYEKSYALDKTPVFLQGAKTSLITKERIRMNLVKNKSFKEVVINYKKDKTEYKCEVMIVPLFNEKTTHFLALEKLVI